MKEVHEKYDDYFKHLKKLSLLGRIYHRLFKLPLLYLCLRIFGRRAVEVGCGIGNGVLGTFSSKMVGIDVNPHAVKYCNSIGLKAHLIGDDGVYPFEDDFFDSVLLDNVLEHISIPKATLDECWRISGPRAGLVIAVPGVSGFNFDSDHKIFYDEKMLRNLDARWRLLALFSIPFIFKSEKLSRSVRQYCLLAVYRKN